MENLTLYGVALGALAITIVKVIQDKTNLSEEIAIWVRAFLGVVVYLAITNADWLVATIPNFEGIITQFGGAASVFLGVLGYWPEFRRVGYRVQGRAVD